jgi:hypothetical protein
LKIWLDGDRIQMLRRSLALLIMLMCSPLSQAQEVVTSTPVRIDIPTDAGPAIEVLATVTATRTPTQSAVVLEAKADAGAVNVRAEPDIEGERLGTIQAGEFYIVLGRYFRWIQFQFDTAPNGRAWVFDELVTLTGDESSIPDLSVETLPTVDPAIAGATQTQDAVTLTPGGLLTATAQSRFLALPTEGGNGVDNVENGLAILPTFTVPPELALAPTEDLFVAVPTTSPESTPLNVPTSVPPILPIFLLAAGGVLGLVVSSLRR